MKLCFDTNVVIDIFGESEDFFYSYSAYDVALTRGFDVCLPMFVTSDIAYILRRYCKDKQRTRVALGNVLELFDMLDGHPLDCKQAFNSKMDDYEDALLAFASERNGVDFIITRNKKDFLHSPVPAMTPQEFVTLYKPEGISYAMVDIGTL
jgi:predicted nucleic acid-binding protein